MSTSGVLVDPKKVKVVMSWERSKCNALKIP